MINIPHKTKPPDLLNNIIPLYLQFNLKITKLSLSLFPNLNIIDLHLRRYLHTIAASIDRARPVSSKCKIQNNIGRSVKRCVFGIPLPTIILGPPVTRADSINLSPLHHPIDNGCIKPKGHSSRLPLHSEVMWLGPVHSKRVDIIPWNRKLHVIGYLPSELQRRVSPVFSANGLHHIDLPTGRPGTVLIRPVWRQQPNGWP